ncbi:hypothetical protein PYV61_14285, partial [Roseisolibacter sp. H3M3-2]
LLASCAGAWGCRAAPPAAPAPEPTVVLPAATGALRVVLRDSTRGTPLVGAMALAWVGRSVAFAPAPPPAGAAGDTLVWPALPAGAYRLDVRRIAYVAAERPVRVDGGRTTVVEVALALHDMCDIACDALVIPPRRWWRFWRR